MYEKVKYIYLFGQTFMKTDFFNLRIFHWFDFDGFNWKRKDFNRITLTINAINKSKLIFLWAPKKEKIIKKIQLDKIKKYPVSFLRKKNNLLFYSNWFG